MPRVATPLDGSIRAEDESEILAFLDSLASRGRSPKTDLTYRESFQSLPAFIAAEGVPLLADVRRRARRPA
jgi:hypothetical protein